MSKACSSGTPAFIMVASWRVKMAMSLGLIDLPERMRRFLILLGSTPWRRSEAITWFSPPARTSPRTCLPWRSLPSHSNTNSAMFFDVAVAMMGSIARKRCGEKLRRSSRDYSFVTASTSSSEVNPPLTLCSPDWRSERTPSALACFAMSSALPSRRMICCISSLIGITW